MKKIIAIISIAFIIIATCMVYLAKSGISIRTASLIRPSVRSVDGHNIANSLVIRLAQELKNAHYIVWGILPLNDETSALLDQAQTEFEKTFPSMTVTRLQLGPHTLPEEVRSCPAPCWILTETDHAHELSMPSPMPRRSEIAEKSFLNISVVPFAEMADVTKECEEQKRLDFKCLKMVSVHEAFRKMKKANERYFFLRKYLERDYFLFIQDVR